MGRDHNNLWCRETDNSVPNAKQWAIQNQESCPWDIYWCMQTTAQISFTRHPPYGCKSTKNNEKEILQCSLFCSWEHRHRNLTLHFSCYITQKDNWMQCSFTISQFTKIKANSLIDSIYKLQKYPWQLQSTEDVFRPHYSINDGFGIGFWHEPTPISCHI